MECWAHSEDIREAVGARHSNTMRLKDVAVLGFNTRRWSYLNRGLAMPEEALRVELTSLSGEVWSFGTYHADAGVRGSALAFCLVVTHRRHVDDTRLVTADRSARDRMESPSLHSAADLARPRDTGRRNLIRQRFLPRHSRTSDQMTSSAARSAISVFDIPSNSP